MYIEPSTVSLQAARQAETPENECAADAVMAQRMLQQAWRQPHPRPTHTVRSTMWRGEQCCQTQRLDLIVGMTYVYDASAT